MNHSESLANLIRLMVLIGLIDGKKQDLIFPLFPHFVFIFIYRLSCAVWISQRTILQNHVNKLGIKIEFPSLSQNARRVHLSQFTWLRIFPPNKTGAQKADITGVHTYTYTRWLIKARDLYGLALGLAAGLAALLGPWEVEDGDEEERVAVSWLATIILQCE